VRSVLNVVWNDRLRLAAAAFCYLCIAFLSSVPGDLRPHVPGFSDKLEHLLAFFALGVITVFAAPRALPGRWLATAIVTYAAALEAGQVFIPGREASMADLAASGTGALLGLSLGLALRPSLSALYAFRGQNTHEVQKP
jgi:VanZ family protein